MIPLTPAPSPLQRLGRNVSERLRLVRIACTRRYLHDDLRALIPTEQPEIDDIRGDLHPLEFARVLPGAVGPIPDFSRRLGLASDFCPAGFPSWNSEPSVSAFLGELVLRLQARTVVEVGSFVGWTSAHLALALEAAGTGRLHCVESELSFAETAQANLRRVGLIDRVEFHAGLSLDPAVIGRLPTSCELVFIDASHQYDDTVREISTYGALLTAGGCLVLHDSIRWGGVRRAVREVADRFQTLTYATDGGNGLTVLRQRS